MKKTTNWLGIYHFDGSFYYIWISFIGIYTKQLTLDARIFAYCITIVLQSDNYR